MFWHLQNWDQAQTVYVSGIDNMDIEGDVYTIIHHSIDLDVTTDEVYRNLTLDSIDVSVMVLDNDSPGLDIRPRTVRVTGTLQPLYLP